MATTNTEKVCDIRGGGNIRKVQKIEDVAKCLQSILAINIKINSSDR